MKNLRITRRDLMRSSAIVSAGIAASGLSAGLIGRAAAQNQTPVTLRMQNWFSDSDMTDWQVGLDMVKKLHPNIDVKLEFAPYNDTVTRTLVAASANDLPDIIMCSTDHTPSLVTSGVLADLTSFIQKDPTVKPEDFAHGVAQGFDMWGRWWGFPYDVSTFGIYYNKAMFDAAGVAYPPKLGEAPWTWEQFVDAAKKLTKPNGAQFGVAWEYPAPNQYIASSFIYAAGGRNFDDALRHCIINSPEAAAGVQFMVDLINKYKVAPTVAEAAGGGVNYFESGLAAMSINGQWALGQTKKDVDFPWDVTYLPVGKVKKLATGGSGFAISATTKHPEEAWQFLRAFTSTEVLGKMIGSTGRGIPARLSASPTYVTAAPTPNARIFVDQLAYAANDRSALGFAEFLDSFNRELEPIFASGDGSVLEALKRVAATTNKVLDERWAAVKIKI